MPVYILRWQEADIAKFKHKMTDWEFKCKLTTESLWSLGFRTHAVYICFKLIVIF